MSDNPYRPPQAELADLAAHEESAAGISLAEFSAFTGKSAYPPKLKRFYQKETRTAGFNLWATVFGSNWFIYRKLYLSGAIAVLLELSLPIAGGFVYGLMRGSPTHWPYVTLVSFVVGRVFLGFFANIALGWKAVSVIQKIDKLNLDNATHLQQITQTGGVNLVALIIFVVAVNVIKLGAGTF